MELACAPSAVSNAASSFFGAPMFESSSVISDMPSSASVTDGTARRADARQASGAASAASSCSESLATARRFTRVSGRKSDNTMLVSRSAMLVLACASGSSRRGRPHARPTRLAASTDSDDRVTAVPNCSASSRRPDARGAPCARPSSSSVIAARCKTCRRRSTRARRGCSSSTGPSSARCSACSRSAAAFVRAEVTGRDRGETAPVRFDLRRAEGDAAWALVGVRSEADGDEADDADDGGEGGGGRRPDRPSKSPRSRPRRVRARSAGEPSLRCANSRRRARRRLWRTASKRRSEHRPSFGCARRARGRRS